MITQGDARIDHPDQQPDPASSAQLPRNIPRFYVGPADPPRIGPSGAVPASVLAVDGRVTLDDDESRHALRVLRLSESDGVELIDGTGALAAATIVSTAGKRATCRVNALRRVDPPRPHLTLATAIPKGPRGDDMVNDLAQLGVDELVPLRTARSVVDPRDTKLARYQRAAIEAAKQCGRAWMMRIGQTLDFEAALGLGAELILVADPAGEPTSAVRERLPAAGRVLVLIGPEGGLTDAETALAEARGAVRWRYNDHILRIETAAAAAVAILRSLA